MRLRRKQDETVVIPTVSFDFALFSYQEIVLLFPPSLTNIKAEPFDVNFTHSATKIIGSTRTKEAITDNCQNKFKHSFHIHYRSGDSKKSSTF